MPILSAYDVARDEFSKTGFLDYYQKVVIDHSDLDASFQYDVTVPAGTLVLDVSGVVSEAFAGGTPVIDVGDGSDPDAWIDSTNSDLAEDTLNSYACSANIAANAFTAGKYYAAAGLIRVTMATGLTAGKLTLLIHCLNFTDSWRAAGDIGQNDYLTS